MTQTEACRLYKSSEAVETLLCQPHKTRQEIPLPKAFGTFFPRFASEKKP